MSKQSSIEWLDRWFRDNPEATHEEGNKALQQAKQMHKEEIVEAFIGHDSDTEENIDVAEQYYQETYGGNNE